MKTLFEALHPEDAPPLITTPISELTGKEFSQAVLDSREFREYIINGIKMRDIPPAILCRVIDHGWGKPPDRIEHTGKDGNPIETITEVRRVIVHAHVNEMQDAAAVH